jgi:hypothetical protein
MGTEGAPCLSMRMVCAWCGMCVECEEIAIGEGITHGICAACTVEHFAAFCQEDDGVDPARSPMAPFGPATVAGTSAAQQPHGTPGVTLPEAALHPGAMHDTPSGRGGARQ